MIPFMVVLIAAIIGFGISEKAIGTEGIESSLDGLGSIFVLIFGDFSGDSYDEYGWVLFILA